LQTAAVKIGFDLSLFSRFAEDNAALTVQQLAEETKADSLFMSELSILHLKSNDMEH
jgi:hypothetical protein